MIRKVDNGKAMNEGEQGVYGKSLLATKLYKGPKIALKK